MPQTRQQTNKSKPEETSSPSKGKVFFVTTNDLSPVKTPGKRGRPRGTRGGKSQEAKPRTTPRETPRKRQNKGDGSFRGVNEQEPGDDEQSESNAEGGSTSEGSDTGRRVISELAEGAATVAGKGLIHRTAFDSYFAATSKAAQTSDNVFSEMVPPLTPEEYARILAESEADEKHAENLQKVQLAHEKLFPRYALEISEGFNLLFFGFGSKRNLLNKFATYCARRGYVAVVNGYMPRIGIKDLIASIEEIPELTTLPLPTGFSGLEAQARRIYEYFTPSATRPSSIRPLFIIIHNIDCADFRNSKSKALLSLLALNPRIHLAASVDHINAQMLWSLSESSTRKHQCNDEADIPPTRGFAWVWHDMTTMEHYDVELANLGLVRISNRSAKLTVAERGMTETAAQHILVSVNVRAKRLFALLAKTLLASFEEAGNAAKAGEKPLQPHAVSHQSLFNAARDDFIATNDTSFKALLGEFFDHGLVMTTTIGGAESLWIPLRVEELRRVLGTLGIDK